MRIRILRPVEQAGQGPLGPADEEWAHRELGTESAGQFILGGHRGLERIASAVFRRVEPVQGDEGHMRQVEEHSETEPLGARQRRRERAGEDGDGVVVDRRQMPAKDTRQVLATPENGQRPQALVGIALEPVGVEGGMDQREVVGEAPDGLAVEESGERTALRDEPGRLGQTKTGKVWKCRVRCPHRHDVGNPSRIGQRRDRVLGGWVMAVSAPEP